MAALAGATVLVSLFLPWYAIGHAGSGVSKESHGAVVFDSSALTLTAWRAFSVVDVVLAVCAVTIIAAVALRHRLGRERVGLAGLVAAAVCAGLTTWRLISPPSIPLTLERRANVLVLFGHGFTLSATSVKYGGFVALAGSLVAFVVSARLLWPGKPRRFAALSLAV